MASIAGAEAWSSAISDWLVVLRAAGRPSSTIYLRGYQLRRLAAGVAPSGPFEVTGEQLVAWVGGRSWAPETLRSMRSAIRGFYRWAHGSGHLGGAGDPALALPSVAAAHPDPRPAPEDAYRLALAKSDDRVRLMLRLAAELGLRRAEVAQVHSRDVERDLTGWTLRVLGKGRKVRRLPLTDALAAALGACGPGFAFPGAVEGHVSAAWCGRLVSRALPAAWAMHSLRHRFGTVAFAIDRDLLTVQELMGHASPVTTRRYVMLPAESMRRTVAAVARVS